MTSTPSASVPAGTHDRVAFVQRNTSETQIGVRVNLDGTPIVVPKAAKAPKKSKKADSDTNADSDTTKDKQ